MPGPQHYGGNPFTGNRTNPRAGHARPLQRSAPHSSIHRASKFRSGGRRADDLGLGQRVPGAAGQQHTALNIAVYQNRRGAQQPPPAQPDPPVGVCGGGVEPPLFQKTVQLGRQLTVEQLILARTGCRHDMLPVADQHTTAEPPCQHIGVDGGRFAQLRQRRVFFKDDLAVFLP